jgi:nucleoside-diphosphate-sugar epimerase
VGREEIAPSESARPCLVTGGTGFLGGHLVERLLAAGQLVRVLARNPTKADRLAALGADVAVGDVTDAGSLAAAAKGCDLVYHLAAHVSDWGPWETFESVTVRGTENMLAAAAQAGVRRFVLVSTALVYDDRFARRARVVTEDAPLGEGDRAYGHYSKAKVLAEQAAWKAHADGKVSVRVIRPAWIYGPRDHTILPRLLEHFEGPLACWIGSKDPSADAIYVTDVADAAILAANHDQAHGQAYNIAPVEEVRLREFLGALFRELDIRPPRFTVPVGVANSAAVVSEFIARLVGAKKAPEMTRAGIACITVDQHVDPSKAMRELGWTPKVALAEGARLTAQWIKAERKK